MRVEVTAIRASYLTVCVHDQLSSALGSDEQFVQRLVDLKDIRRQQVGLPFAKDLPVDSRFWSKVAEEAVQVPVSPEKAKRLRRHFVPLRWADAVVTGKVLPRIEAHLHRFGVVAIATVDLTWETPVPFEEVWSRLAEAESQGLRAALGTHTQFTDTTVRDASRAFAMSLAEEIQDEPASIFTEPLTRRIVTVIDGKSDAPFQEMPPANSPFHIALHHLASGEDVIAAPAAAFVPQWNMAGYVFPPSRMMYTLSAGSASLIESAIRPPSGELYASNWHRERTLITAYVCALADLVESAPQSTSGAFRAWAGLAAQTLARLYGPSRDYLEWGQYPAAILTRTGAITAVRDALGGKLSSNVDFPVSPYPK